MLSVRRGQILRDIVKAMPADVTQETRDRIVFLLDNYGDDAPTIATLLLVQSIDELRDALVAEIAATP